MYAAYAGAAEAVSLLAPKESSMTDTRGYTALMLAAARGHTKVVQQLVSREAGMFLVEDTTDFPKNTTALLMAA